MNKTFATVVAPILVIYFFTGCGESGKGPPADLVVRNAKIYTADRGNPQAEAVAVKGEFIIAVTSAGAISQHTEKGTSTVIDSWGRPVIPGFYESPIQFVFGGQSMMILSLKLIG